MKCNKCGTENSPGTKFCRGCGTKCEPIAPVLPDNMTACAKCGHTNQLGKKFCEKCGGPLAVSATPVTPEVPYSLPPPAPPPPIQAMPEPAPMPYAAANMTGVYQPSANPRKTKMIIGAVAAVIALSGIGSGGYWYYQKVETEKAIALQRQQEVEQRLKAEAEAKAEEARKLVAQNARLEAEKRAIEERRVQMQPAEVDAGVKQKVAEVILAASACRTNVTETYQDGRNRSMSPNSWGCTTNSPYVRELFTDSNGKITVIARNIDSNINGKALTLTPTDNSGAPLIYKPGGKSNINWACGGSGTTIPESYLPSPCRKH